VFALFASGSEALSGLWLGSRRSVLGALGRGGAMTHQQRKPCHGRASVGLRMKMGGMTGRRIWFPSASDPGEEEKGMGNKKKKRAMKGGWKGAQVALGAQGAQGSAGGAVLGARLQ
jgi:hypothetical protein